MHKQKQKQPKPLNDQSFAFFNSKKSSLYCYGKSLSNIIFNDVFNWFNLLLIAFIVVFCLLKSYWFIAFACLGFVVSIFEMIYDIRSFRQKRTIRYSNVTGGGQIRISKETEIKIGDLISLNSGSYISCDGTLNSGSLLVDESSIRGSSSPVFKKVGSPLFAGTRVLCGNGVFEVDKKSQDSYCNLIKGKSKNITFKEPRSFLAVKKTCFLLILSTLVLSLALILLVYFKNQFNDEEIKKSLFQNLYSLSLVVVPVSLMIVFTIFFFVKIRFLFKKGAKVNDFRSLDSFSGVDVVCVDKTGTITDGTFKIEKIISCDSQYNEKEIHNVLCQVVNANLPCKDWFTDTLRKYFFDKNISSVDSVIKFDETGEYTSITSSDGHKYSLGLAETFSLTENTEVLNKVVDYQLEGNFVLILSNNDADKIKPVAILVLSENVKQNAIDTLRTFISQGIKVKLLSGDDPLIVSRIAKLIGIENAESFVSSKGMGLEQIKTFAAECDVFGKCTPEQKQAVIQQLRKDKHVVAMIGDNTNDILAMKESDYSINVNEQDEDINNVSQLILKDANYFALSEINKESCKNHNILLDILCSFVIYASFYLCFQTLYAVSIFAHGFTETLGLFEINLFWSLEAIFLFINNVALSLTNDQNVISSRKTLNSISKAVFAGGVLFISIFVVLGTYLLTYQGIDLRMDSLKEVFNSCVLLFAVLFYVFDLITLRPVSKKKIIITFVVFILNLITLMVINFTKLSISFNIDLGCLDVYNYLTVLIIAAASFVLCFALSSLMNVKKGHKAHD